MTLERIVDISRAMGNLKRLRMLLALKERPMNGSELMEILETTQSDTSANISILRDCELVHSFQDGKSVCNQLTDDGSFVTSTIISWMNYD